jgi:hypothetical protein
LDLCRTISNDELERLGRDLEGTKIWAKKFRDGLKNLDMDLDLRLAHHLNVYIAIDFYDVVSLLFPEQRIFLSNNSEDELRRAIAREALFNNLGNFYKYPIILLPPYLSESVDFFRLAADRLLYMENDEFREELNNRTKMILNRLKNKDHNLSSGDLSDLEKSALYLALYFGPYFMTGIKGFKDLLAKEKLSPKPPIDNYLEIISNIKDKENVFYLNFKGLRPKRTIQNIRDSKAVQYVNEINNKLDGDGILFLMTSASAFRKFESECNISRLVDAHKCSLTRDIDCCYYAIIEAYILLEYNLRADVDKDISIDLNNNQLKLLHEIIKKHLAILEAMNNLTEGMINAVSTGSISGRFLEMAEVFINFKNIMENMERAIVLNYIKDISYKEDLSHLVNYFNQTIINYLEDLRESLKSESFSKIIHNRISELFNEQMDYEKLIMESTTEHYPEYISKLVDCVGKEEWDEMKINKEKLNKTLKAGFPLDDPQFITLSDNKYLIIDNARENDEIYLAELRQDGNYSIDVIKLYYLYKFMYSLSKKGDVDSTFLKRSANIELARKIITNMGSAKYIHKDELITIIDKISSQND